MSRMIYISGKISGMEEQAKAIFDDAEKKLKEKGYAVLNPMKLPHEHDKSWVSYMVECIRAMAQCDSIFMLSNWHESRGARVEHEIALRKRMRIFYQSEG